MATLSLKKLAEHLRDIDICMMVTTSKRGSLNARPMSNNRDVQYKGDNYFFTYEKTKKVKDIEGHPQVSLNFEGAGGLFISVAGKAKLIRNRALFAEHWDDSLNQWFEQGVETPGIVLIHVKGSRMQYWQKDKQGEVSLGKK